MIYYCIYLLILIALAVLSLIGGAVRFIVKGDMVVLRNGLVLFFTNFTTDKKKGVIYGILYLFLRHSWEIPQTLLGYLISQIRNIFWRVDRVEVFCGVAYAIKYNHNHNSGVSLGNFININTYNHSKEDFRQEVVSEPLLMHEFGHTIDSRRFGVLYLFVIGIPSLVSAIRAHQVENEPQGVSSHYFSWCERRANWNALLYFKKYFSVDWTSSYKGYTIETFYRLPKRG